jgi:hypothetical protein
MHKGIYVNIPTARKYVVYHGINQYFLNTVETTNITVVVFYATICSLSV